MGSRLVDVYSCTVGSINWFWPQGWPHLLKFLSLCVVLNKVPGMFLHKEQQRVKLTWYVLYYSSKYPKIHCISILNFRVPGYVLIFLWIWNSLQNLNEWSISSLSNFWILYFALFWIRKYLLLFCRHHRKYTYLKVTSVKNNKIMCHLKTIKQTS